MLRDALEGLLAALGRRIAPEGRGPELHTVRGIRVEVLNTRPDIDTAFVLARLDEALALVERHQPWRLAHLRRDLAGIRIVRYPCRGAYLPEQRVCITELTFLARAAEFSPAQVASSVLHEGMHARVHRMSRGRVTWDRAREERLCRRVELEFGESLPPALGAVVVARARASLELADEEVAPAIDWAEAGRRVRLADEDAARRPDQRG